MPAADEVHRLQSCDSPECRLFQKIAKQDESINPGPTPTKQGIWVATPGGRLLGSINSNSASHVRKMLEKALETWKRMPDEKRLLDRAPSETSDETQRPEDRYPDDGLVLSVYSRDLERTDAPSGWKSDAWNRDFAWFKKEEARGLLPDRLEKGTTQHVSAKLIHRLARIHLVDNVRGQTRTFPPRAVRKAKLTSRVTAVDGSRVRVRYRGTTKAKANGEWSVCGFDDRNDPQKRERGYHASLYGRAVYNRKTERFDEFELVAAGRRWGGTQYNGRCNDLEPAPMGVYLTLAGDKPGHRLAPAHFWKYEW